MPTEKQLDKALELALQRDETFRKWFISNTRVKVNNPEWVWSRSDNPWGKVKVRLPTGANGELEVVEREGETDILFVFRTESGRRVALHIENKLALGQFRPFQPELYNARAELWLQNPKYGNYDEWATVLVAPVSFRSRHAVTAQKFGAFISHEDIASHVSDHKTRILFVGSRAL